MKRMNNIIFIGEINHVKIDFNFRDSIYVFAVSISLMIPKSQERQKLGEEILKICREYEGDIGCPIVFDRSEIIRCRFEYREAAEAFKDTIKLEYNL